MRELSTNKQKQAQRAEPHCWKDGPEETVLLDLPAGETDNGQWWGRLRSIGSTCMLPDGHEGEHVFTPDDAIGVTFKEKEEESSS